MPLLSGMLKGKEIIFLFHHCVGSESVKLGQFLIGITISDMQYSQKMPEVGQIFILKSKRTRRHTESGWYPLKTDIKQVWVYSNLTNRKCGFPVCQFWGYPGVYILQGKMLCRKFDYVTHV